MIDHYNAFISYRHSPEDIKVAEAVQRGLEHFHIPAKIKKDTGIRRIDRIFRDKDELPITSDLTDTIANALAHSDYLIVICSTNTKDSAWVPREIEFFLRNHTKKQIFTVLVNGDPMDVIPQELQYEDRVVTDNLGNQQIVRMPIEPLSCDYRMSIKKAEKTELPRLASGLIGCSYDELMNRRRQYMMRRVMIGCAATFSVLLAFTMYTLYSYRTIQKNYLESLRNQSKYLANEAEELLENEQRITALQLVLEALPKNEDDKRPVTAEAIRALTEGTLAYESYNGINIHASWNYIMPNSIMDFKVSPDSSTIAIYDSENIVGVWNTSSHEQVLYLDKLGDRIKGMSYLSDKSLVFWSDDKMVCYDTSSGDKKWENSLKDYYFLSQDNIMVYEGGFYIATDSYSFIEVESETGKIKREISLKQLGDKSIIECKLSPDGKKIAFRGNNDLMDTYYGMIDLDTDKVDFSEGTDQYIKDIEWIDNDTFLTSSVKVDGSNSSSIGYIDILSEDHNTIYCVNAKDFSEKWKADFVCTGVNVNSGFFLLEEAESVIYYAGNVAATYNVKTGEEKYVHNVNSSIIDVSDRDGDGSPIYITNDGTYTYPATSISDRTAYSVKYFADELIQVEVNSGVYVRQNIGNEVIYYGVGVYDDEWKAFSEDVSISSLVIDHYMNDNVLAVITEEDAVPTLTIIRLGEGDKVQQIKLSEESSYSYHLLGIDEKNVYLNYEKNSSLEAISVDIDSGEIEREILSDKYVTTYSKKINESNKYAFVYNDEDFNYILGLYDFSLKKLSTTKLPADAGIPYGDPLYFYNANSVYYLGENEYIVDIKDGSAKKVELPKQWNGTTVVSGNSDGEHIAVSDGKRIVLIDKDGEQAVKIECPGNAPLGLSFTPDTDELVVFYSDGSLYWYSNSGIFKKKTKVTCYNSYSGDVRFDYDTNNGIMYLQLETITDMIDMKSGVETASIQDCFGYNKKLDIFVTKSYDTKHTSKLGYYKRYNVDELLEKAREITDGTELSDELKSQYGIDD